MHISDGDPTVFGILGAKTPRSFVAGSPCKAFFHGAARGQRTYELILHR